MVGSPWKQRAQGSTVGMVADRAEMERAFRLFCDPENACEVRALTTGAHRTLDGSDIDGLCGAAATLPGGIGIYFVLNPLPQGLDSPARNDDVVYRKWVYIDVDPPKPDGKGKSATDDEKEQAAALGREVQQYLAGHGWPAPVVVDSGNGVALYYWADLPNDEIVRAAYTRLLGTLAKRFAELPASIDKSVHSAAQLVKLPGTWARKGPDSDDRPHRPCRITFVPRDLEKLTFDELKAAGGQESTAPPSTNGTAAAPTKAVALRALEAGCARVLMAAKGEGRNNALNAVAFDMGRRFVNVGVLTADEIGERLYEAACQAGLETDDNCGPEGIRKTIASGLGSGAKLKPEPIPVIGKAGAEQKPTETGPLIYWASEVEPRSVEWLWPGRIPLGKLTTFAGNGGLGKTFVLCDIMARVSRAMEWPDQSANKLEPSRCLFISGEDDPDDTLVPRMIELGADLTRIAFLKTEVLDRFTLADLDTLDGAVAQMGGETRFVGIDPPTAYLGGVNDHKNAELRGLLTPLMLWAKKHRLSVVFNTHVNKPQGAKVEAMMRVMGSVAWVNAMRSAYMFAKDPADHERRLFVGMKNNLGGEKKGLAYRIEPTAALARLNWLGEVDTTADDAMNNQATKKKRSVIACEWLAELFATTDQLPSKTVWKSADETTLSRNAVLEAKEEMGIKARQETDGEGLQQWTWTWPPGARQAWKDRTQNPGVPTL